MHVLILPSWYPNSYAPVHGTFFREQVDALKESGVQVGVVAPVLRSLREFNFRNIIQNHCQISYDNENGVDVYRKHGWQPPKGGRLSRILWLKYARNLFDHYVAEHGLPDIVHAHCHMWAGVAAKEIRKNYGIPFIITEHFSGYITGTIPSWALNEVACTASSASKVLAVSRALSNKLEYIFESIKVDVMPNMVDLDFFSLPIKRPPRTPFKFLFVGFLYQKKAVDILISAFSLLVHEGYDVFLDIGGNGPEQTKLKKLVEIKGVSHRVKFLGLLSREKVREAMWQSHTFVLPSYVETFGVVLLEAMSTGLPVIATRCGGPDEFVGNQSGILVDTGDVMNLANAMKNLVNKNESDFSSQWIRNNIRINFGRDNVVKKILGIYREVID